MIVLTDRGDVWRLAQRAGQTAGKLTQQVVYQSVACLVTPISAEDAQVAYARESTHTIMLPGWLSDLIQVEDEIRVGRRTSSSGQITQYRYVVAGVRRYGTFGLRHVEVAAKERQ